MAATVGDSSDDGSRSRCAIWNSISGDAPPILAHSHQTPRNLSGTGGEPQFLTRRGIYTVRPGRRGWLLRRSGGAFAQALLRLLFPPPLPRYSLGPAWGAESPRRGQTFPELTVRTDVTLFTAFVVPDVYSHKEAEGQSSIFCQYAALSANLPCVRTISV